MRLPSPLTKGATLAVVAPSSGFDRARLERGVEALAEEFDVRLAPGLFATQGYLAGDDASRLADLQWALQDTEVSAIVAARGGYGATRLLPALPTDTVAATGKWLLGFSDITALHGLWARAGLCSVHGAMLASWCDAPAAVRDQTLAILAGTKPAPLRGLDVLAGGTARGPLTGGNLAVLQALVGTPYAPPLEGRVLFLEDVGERPYRVDRMLTSLSQAGWFERVAGVLLGGFTDCAAGPDGTTVEQVLQERLGPLGIPVLSGAPCGHLDHNAPLLLGATVTLEGRSGSASYD